MGGDVVAELEVLLGIADVDPTTEDGDGRTARLERAAVGRGVDAPGQAADHLHPGVGELIPDAVRDVEAGEGRAA